MFLVDAKDEQNVSRQCSLDAEQETRFRLGICSMQSICWFVLMAKTLLAWRTEDSEKNEVEASFKIMHLLLRAGISSFPLRYHHLEISCLHQLSVASFAAVNQVLWNSWLSRGTDKHWNHRLHRECWSKISFGWTTCPEKRSL